MQAWCDCLEGRGKVVHVNIFVGTDNLCIPTLFDQDNAETGSDRETLAMLRMWYCWTQMKRGFSEILLPRKLLRLYKLEVESSVSGIKRLGDRIEALELGRNGSGHVANLEDTERISERERTQSLKMPDDPGTKGLEFVRAWDSAAVSMMSLTPFVLSLIFCGGWMGVSIGKLQVDAQVATQTAFTVATFIVTAGALLIALFAFLDTQAQDTQ